MNDTSSTYSEHRSRNRNQFLTRCYRYQVLLRTKWWIPALATGLGLGAAATFAWTRPPAFTSFGRMIVSIKLSLPEGSVYAEEMGSFLGTQTALMQSQAVIDRAWARITSDSQDPQSRA